MPTRTIPSEEWSTFLDSFSTQLATRSVAVRFSDPELGYQLEMIRVPLIGVTFDPRSGGGPRIEVMVGRTDFDHTTHAVSKPVAVRLKEDEQGEAEVLELESGDGGKTLVLLKPGALGEPGALTERD